MPPTALRLTFSYENDNIYLVSQQRLELIASPSDALVGFAGGQGSWIEVRTERDRMLYRQVLSEALRGDFEVLSPDPGQSITRVRVARQSGIFTVLVPDFAEADYIALASSAPGESNAHQPSSHGSHLALTPKGVRHELGGRKRCRYNQDC